VRQAARILLVDAADRLLLFEGCDPADPGAGTFWLTPGGGLEPGESPAQGAARELAEETGLVVAADELGPVVGTRRCQFDFAGTSYVQQESFFLLRVSEHDVRTDGWNALEVASLRGHRWWSAAQLLASGERVYPADLGRLLPALLDARRAGREDGPPLELGE